MKKYLRYADVLVLFTGALGLFLRLIITLGGTDAKGLYPKNHPAWIILCILSAAVVAALWLLTRQVGADQRYKKNFPASRSGAVCAGLAAIGIAATALDLFATDLLSIVCFLTGIASMASLLFAAYCRFLGKKPHYICHAAPAVFFALRLFLLGQSMGSETESSRYLFEMLASVAMIPACYQLWGFDVGMGKRENSLFWSLTAAYLCVVAIVGVENWLLYVTCTAWLLTNTCSLQYLPKKMRPVPVQSEQDIPETDSMETAAPAEVSQSVAAETPAQPLEDIDPEAILAEILREIDKTVE